MKTKSQILIQMGALCNALCLDSATRFAIIGKLEDILPDDTNYDLTQLRLNDNVCDCAALLQSAEDRR